ncbi:MAG: hypothetical protein OJF55_000410 [Rhodanobacteraceae bacterium]|jgi:hypothetical protein|nr:MAG: hypothetical protein OJF55_000410 [Rhodanobacteraceae bacterium]
MKSLRIALLLPLGLAAAGLIAPTAYADPPPWAPAHGWRAKHQYVYYPSAEVYYAPESRMWFWLGGNGWQAGVSLPLALQGYVQAGGVNISLDVDRPYLRNDYVVQRYGGHPHRWRGDDHDHGHGHKHHHDDD